MSSIARMHAFVTIVARKLSLLNTFNFLSIMTTSCSTEDHVLDRAMGVLYGQAVGDALGSRYEFKRAADVKAMIQMDRNGDGFLNILGGGPFKMIGGQVTDDTEMAMGMARSILRCNGYQQADVACSYVRWNQTSPPDIGGTTLNALTIPSALKKGLRLDDWHRMIKADQKQQILAAVIKNSKDKNGKSLSNGCLMRAAPLVLIGLVAEDNSGLRQEELMSFCEQDTSLTNPSLVTYDGVKAFVTAARTLATTGDNKLALQAAVDRSTTTVIKRHLSDATTHPIPVHIEEKDKPSNGDDVAIGYIGVALQSAFYELLHATSFEQGLIDAISRGGDTDTNGCIVGMMLGARFGRNGIPNKWQQTVQNARPNRLKQYPEVSLSDIEQVVKGLVHIPL